MNDFFTSKQADTELEYTNHARKRCIERNVPVSKYIPIDAETIDQLYVDGVCRYNVRFVYRGKKYCFIIDDDFLVYTAYRYDPRRQNYSIVFDDLRQSTKERQRNMRKNIDNDYYASSGKYKHLEIENALLEYAQM